MKSSRRSPLAELYMISVITMSVTASAAKWAPGAASADTSARAVERRVVPWPIRSFLLPWFPGMPQHPAKLHPTSGKGIVADGSNSGARRDGCAAQLVRGVIVPAEREGLFRRRSSQELELEEVDRVGEVEDAGVVDI